MYRQSDFIPLARRDAEVTGPIPVTFPGTIKLRSTRKIHPTTACNNGSVIRRDKMPDSKYCLRALLVLLCLAALGTQFSRGESSKVPTSWWPDPSTGLMWAGSSPGSKMNWKEANEYCSALQLGGYPGWRLPTLDEVKSAIYAREVVLNNGDTAYYWDFKGGISVGSSTWTSTLDGDQKAWGFESDYPLSGMAGFFSINLSGRWMGLMIYSALCTRSMEAGLLQIAKDAQASGPVPDLVTLKASVPLAKARFAYQAGRFQESLTESKNALLIKPDLAYAYWGIGVSYGGLGQWDLAITNFETALKIDKNYGQAKDSLKWAKEGQKAAKNGKSPKAQSPQWN